MAKREEKKNSTDALAPTWPLSSWRPQADLVFTLRCSLNTSTPTRTTPQLQSETPGPPSKPPSTAASPNNNSGQSPRDYTAFGLTPVFPLPRFSLSPFCYHHSRFSPTDSKPPSALQPTLCYAALFRSCTLICGAPLTAAHIRTKGHHCHLPSA